MADMHPAKPYLTADGKLRIVRWAHALDTRETMAPDEVALQLLGVSLAPRPMRMPQSPATGQGLVTNGHLGVDIIRLGAGRGFVPHTHPGDHLLICVGGLGTITYDGHIYPTQAGQVYMVEGEVPHAVGAITDHVILAVGSPHKAVDDTGRMQPVAYREVLAELGSLTCLICQKTATYPTLPHDIGCTHCPCAACNIIPQEVV